MATPLPTTIRVQLPYPEEPTPFRCPICSISYKAFTSYTRHVVQKHPGKVEFSFGCAVCGVTFPSASTTGGCTRRPATDSTLRSRKPTPPPPAGTKVNPVPTAARSHPRGPWASTSETSTQRRQQQQQQESGPQRSMPGLWMPWRSAAPRPTSLSPAEWGRRRPSRWGHTRGCS